MRNTITLSDVSKNGPIGVWITKSGLMCWTKETGHFFCANDGTFRRYASKEEGESLEPMLPEIYEMSNGPIVHIAGK